MKNQSLSPIRKKGWIYLLFSFVFFSSCVDQINFKVPDGLEEAVVIQATLIKGDPSEIKVQISRLFNFTLVSFNPLNAEEVILRNDDGQSIKLTNRGLGNYEAYISSELSPFEVDFNKTYQLEVRMGANRVFLSEMEPLLPVPKMDSITVAVVEKVVADPIALEETILDTFVAFYLHTPLEAEGQTELSNVRWIMERTAKVTERVKSRIEIEMGYPRLTCYITEDKSVLQPKSFKGSGQASSYLNREFMFAEELNYLFSEGYYCSIYQESLSKGAAEYFSAIEEVVQRDGNMFESTPGRPNTNFSNPDKADDPVYGYFYATARDTIRKYIAPNVLAKIDTYCTRNLFVECPNVPIKPCYPDVCLGCLVEEGSDTMPPPFWKE